MEQKVNIWGVPSNSNTPPTNNDTLVDSRTSRGLRRIRWNLWDALLGFGLMLGTQIIASIILAVYLAVTVFKETTSLEEDQIDNIFDTVMETALSGPFLFFSSVLMYLSWWGAAMIASKKRGLGKLSKDFWLTFRWGRDISLGLLFAGMLRAVEQGVFWLLENVIKMDLEGLSNSEQIMDQQGIWFIIMGIVVASICAPFFEELFFRGLVMQSLIRTFGRIRTKSKRNPGQAGWFYRNRVWLGMVISSALFGIMHFQGDASSVFHWIVVIQTGLIGLVLAFVVMKTKRLGLAIWTHVFFNLSGVVLVRLLGG